VEGEKEKAKKDKYQKALTSYEQAMKYFHKGDCAKASELLKAFIEKHDSEKELVERSQIYLSICDQRMKKEKVSLSTFDDYYQYGVYKVNQGEYEEAIKLLNKAKEMEPKEGKIPYLISLAFCRMDKQEECLEFLKNAVQIDKFFAVLAQNEENFETLREDKKFKLITRMA
jgi:tetratricopeptide (TPR) repeat protein